MLSLMSTSISLRIMWYYVSWHVQRSGMTWRAVLCFELERGDKREMRKILDVKCSHCVVHVYTKRMRMSGKKNKHTISRWLHCRQGADLVVKVFLVCDLSLFPLYYSLGQKEWRQEEMKSLWEIERERKRIVLRVVVPLITIFLSSFLLIHFSSSSC